VLISLSHLIRHKTSTAEIMSLNNLKTQLQLMDKCILSGFSELSYYILTLHNLTLLAKYSSKIQWHIWQFPSQGTRSQFKKRGGFILQLQNIKHILSISFLIFLLVSLSGASEIQLSRFAILQNSFRHASHEPVHIYHYSLLTCP
jgi:hypothetical protein